MPRFGHDVFTDEQVDAIVKYVEYLREPEHPGGLSLGYTGPVAEGFVALLIGLGVLILAIRWITREPDQPDEPPERPVPTATPTTGGSGEPSAASGTVGEGASGPTSEAGPSDASGEPSEVVPT
jgi:hypothetical protein